MNATTASFFNQLKEFCLHAEYESNKLSRLVVYPCNHSMKNIITTNNKFSYFPAKRSDDYSCIEKMENQLTNLNENIEAVEGKVFGSKSNERLASITVEEVSFKSIIYIFVLNICSTD